MFRAHKPKHAILGYIFLAIVSIGMVYAQDWHFEEVTDQAGLNFVEGEETLWSGVAAGDYDGDGWIDLFITRNGASPNLLYRNKGDGTFEEVAVAAGLENSGTTAISPLLVDLNGDGGLDLFVGDFGRTNAKFFRNRQDGTFEDITGITGFVGPDRQIFSTAAGDYDLDGDLDLYIAMNDPTPILSQFWRNNGDDTFTNVGVEAAILDTPIHLQEFSPTFADVNNDGWPDLLVVADFNNSQIYINQRDGTFLKTTDKAVITDEGGMGSAVGDYDNDGDLDWFVSSIWDPAQNPFSPWGQSSGNRLYRNKGDGTFEDATDEAGVRQGFWGWGSTMSDFNNDGHLDIFHTNGTTHVAGPLFRTDLVRMFVSNGDGTFRERSAELGIVDSGIGYGIAAFDYDNDGDLDLFIANAVEQPRLYRNEGGNLGNYVKTSLKGTGANREAIGARLYLHLADSDMTLMREISCGTNFLSQNPSLVHFGIGEAQGGNLEIVWPGGARTILYDVKAGETIRIPQLPVSYDDPSLSYYQYFFLVKTALQESVDNQSVTQAEARRVRDSALKGFILNRYGSSN